MSPKKQKKIRQKLLVFRFSQLGFDSLNAFRKTSLRKFAFLDGLTKPVCQRSLNRKFSFLPKNSASNF